MINEACKSGARKEKACNLFGISTRTVQRWKDSSIIIDDQRKYRKQTPANKLSPEERAEILKICNEKEYKNLPPSQIVPALADKNIYIASESSFYRVLKEANQLKHRGKAKPRTITKPEPYIATCSNQVWTWDITYLPTAIKGSFYYLYMIMDIFSRKIVGWEIYETQTDEQAAKTITKAYFSEGVSEEDLVLHSDNGSPMKGATMLATLQNLGVTASFSRPSVSNDNPYSESLFKTLKYKPGYPVKPFDSLDSSREWTLGFVRWYNEEHKHSGIKFVSPSIRHCGKDVKILENRMNIYVKAKEKHPERWSGNIRDWTVLEKVYLNPGKKVDKTAKIKRAA